MTSECEILYLLMLICMLDDVGTHVWNCGVFVFFKQKTAYEI